MGQFSKLPHLGMKPGNWPKFQNLHLYPLSTLRGRNWAYFCSTGSDFQDTGHFSNLPYLGISGQSSRSCTCTLFQAWHALFTSSTHTFCELGVHSMCTLCALCEISALTRHEFGACCVHARHELAMNCQLVCLWTCICCLCTLLVNSSRLCLFFKGMDEGIWYGGGGDIKAHTRAQGLYWQNARLISVVETSIE